MGQVLAQLIPIALAVALSTVPITVTLFILLSERRQATALPFLSGWVIGTAAGLLLATLAAQALPGRPRQFASLIDDLEILTGSALILYGLATLFRHRRGAQPAAWIEGIGSLGALAALGIGLALNLRPKALLLVSAAGLAISGAPPGVDGGDTLILIVVYTAIATSTVVAPTLATLFFPGRMEPRLVMARDWVNAHGPVVTGVVVILVGVVVLAAGIV